MVMRLPDGISLTPALVEPSGGTAGTLTGTLSKQGDGGVFSGTFDWDEVGIISLTAQVTDNNYLGTGNITKLLSHVGRFTPHHFTLDSLVNGELDHACSTGSFAYSGQSFGYDTLVTPGFTITARSESGAITTYYTGLFEKLDADSVSVLQINADGTQDGSDGTTPMLITHSQLSKLHTDDGAGEHSYTLGADTFIYNRDANALIGAFDSDIDITIASVTDEDDVTTEFSIGNVLSPTSTNIRYGRISMKNAYGSELIELEIPATIEIFNNGLSGFTPHNADTCTTAPTYTVTDVDPTDDLDATTLTHSISVNNSGRFTATLDPPGAGLGGDALVTLDAPSYLQFNHGVSSDPKPLATGTFGIYSGNPVHIYIQQTYQ
jgi:MSHA biogenesis protein MshQ